MTLTELIVKFGKEHSNLLELQKVDKEDSAEIKKQLIQSGETEFLGGGYVAKLTESKTESFDEECLIGILVNNRLDEGIVKTKQYVDMDALEDAIYNGRIDPTKLVPAKTTKITQKLTVKKVKEK